MDCFVEALDDALVEQIESGDLTIIFKHSTRCSISSVALNRVQAFCATQNQSRPIHLVKVIEQRALSNALAEKLHVKHESPQLIITKDNKVLHHLSHLGISESALSSFIEKI